MDCFKIAKFLILYCFVLCGSSVSHSQDIECDVMKAMYEHSGPAYAYDLAYCYMYGEDWKRDFNEAEDLIREAYSAGDIRGKDGLISYLFINSDYPEESSELVALLDGYEGKNPNVLLINFAFNLSEGRDSSFKYIEPRINSGNYNAILLAYLLYCDGRPHKGISYRSDRKCSEVKNAVDRYGVDLNKLDDRRFIDSKIYRYVFVETQLPGNP